MLRYGVHTHRTGGPDFRSPALRLASPQGTRRGSEWQAFEKLERRLAELPADQEIVAYCRGPWCVLSFEAVAVLRQRGYRVRRLEDGFPEWKLAGLPIESVPVR